MHLFLQHLNPSRWHSLRRSLLRMSVPMDVASTLSTRPRSTTPSSPPAKKARLDDSSLIASAGPSVHKPKEKTASEMKTVKKKRFRRPPPPELGSNDDVIQRDVMSLLGPEAVEASKTEGTDFTSPLERGQEIEVVISELTSNGPFRPAC